MKTHPFNISKFGADTLWLLLGQATAMGVGLSLNLIIGFKYGSASLGIFNQSLAYYLIFSTLFAFGLNNTIVKKISEKSRSTNEENQLFSANLLTTLIVSSILSGCLLTGLLLYPDFLSSVELVNTLPAMLLALPFFCINKNFGAYYSGNRKQRSVAFQRIYRWGGLGTLFFTGSIGNYPIEVLMYSFLFIEGSLMLFNLTVNINQLDFRISSKVIYESIRFGLGSYISEITSAFNSSIDIILVAYFLSNEEAGQYSFIAFFVRTLYVFPGILMHNISPIISFHWGQREIEKLNSKLLKMRRINMVVLTLQFLFLVVVYKLIILFIKDGFEITFIAFLIAMVGSYLFAQISWGGSILIMTEQLKANFYRTIIVLILNIAVCSILSYSLGFIGSALAISTNALLSFFLLRTFVYQKTGVRLI